MECFNLVFGIKNGPSNVGICLKISGHTHTQTCHQPKSRLSLNVNFFSFIGLFTVGHGWWRWCRWELKTVIRRRPQLHKAELPKGDPYSNLTYTLGSTWSKTVVSVPAGIRAYWRMERANLDYLHPIGPLVPPVKSSNWLKTVEFLG